LAILVATENRGSPGTPTIQLQSINLKTRGV
jgi:hypothetical protein